MSKASSHRSPDGSIEISLIIRPSVLDALRESDFVSPEATTPREIAQGIAAMIRAVLWAGLRLTLPPAAAEKTPAPPGPAAEAASPAVEKALWPANEAPPPPPASANGAAGADSVAARQAAFMAKLTAVQDDADRPAEIEENRKRLAELG